MQQVVDRDQNVADPPGNDLGIITYLGTTDPPQEEATATTDAADPLQQQDPWGNARLPQPTE